MKTLAAVNGEEMAVDPREAESLCEVEPGVYHVVDGAESREIRVVRDGTNYLVRAGGKTYQVELFDPRERRNRSAAAGGQGRRSVSAPMPGRVVRVLVAVDEAVAAGQGLLVVEAMKMQNEMKSPKAGRVVILRAEAGDTVAAGDVLVVVE